MIISPKLSILKRSRHSLPLKKQLMTSGLTLGALLLGSLLQSGNLVAQGEDEKIVQEPATRWFQIEIAIFSRQQRQAEDTEHWRHDIALAYPPNWVELKSPDSFAEDKTEDEDNKLSHAPQTDPESNANLPPKTEEEPLLAAVDLAREPYFLLPKEHYQLQAEVTSLRRDRRYRLLAHQAWRQPVVSLDRAPSLLIQGGQTFGAHHELEGSISVSVARYLHLRTNLWFSHFVANYGQDRKDWPDLPTRPNLQDEEGNALLFSSDQQSLWSEFQAGEEEYETILAEPYLVDRIVTLTQKRRMRSQEIHYIDHPLLGLLIKITPYELPIEEELGGELEKDENVNTEGSSNGT